MIEGQSLIQKKTQLKLKPNQPTQFCPLAPEALEYGEDANGGSEDSPSEQRLWAGRNQVVQERSLTAP